jgi:flagellar protein FlaF
MRAGYVNKPPTGDARSTEAWALGEASRRLVVASKAADNGGSLRQALILNQRLWTIFQSALAEPNCPLPVEIRDNVLTLSIMMDRQIMQRLGDLDGTKLQPILDINRCVAEGLAQKPAAAAAAGVSEMARPLPTPPTGGTEVAAMAVAQPRLAINVSA